MSLETNSLKGIQEISEFFAGISKDYILKLLSAIELTQIVRPNTIYQKYSNKIKIKYDLKNYRIVGDKPIYEVTDIVINDYRWFRSILEKEFENLLIDLNIEINKLSFFHHFLKSKELTERTIDHLLRTMLIKKSKQRYKQFLSNVNPELARGF